MREVCTILLCSIMIVMISCSSKDTVETIDLDKASIGAMTSTTGERFISENFAQAKLNKYDSITDAVVALKDKKVDYVITSLTNALGFVKNNKGLVIIPGVVLNEGVAIAVNKQDPQLLADISGVLAHFKSNGTLEDIIKRWTNVTNTGYEKKLVQVHDDVSILKVGVAANREPMCFLEKNKIVGLDAELIERIAFELNMKVEYINMPFAALISSLENNKVNVVISNITATEDRKKIVNFTDDYFQNPQVLMRRK